MRRLTVKLLREMKRSGDKIAALTVYDASFAERLEQAGVDVLLVGDSLGMVIQGREDTLSVTVADMIYHCQCVRRGSQRALLVVDMPFMSYATPEQALGNAARMLREGGAQMVKLEGARLDIVEHLTRQGVPVCGHLGLLPQSVHKLGGYRVQGRDPVAARTTLSQARALESAGADLLVLECVPRGLAAEVSLALRIPVIGIGAGADCDGQVLVLYDALGITPGRTPRFARNFLEAGDIVSALRDYVQGVKRGTFPAPDHGFD
jgi:3-methyl-2-oxobutanoate hydroxymethyltransferase